jgi:hypothetical protein
MAPVQIVEGHQKLHYKVVTELQSDEHEVACWSGNYESNLRNQQIVYISKFMKKKGVRNKVKATGKIKIDGVNLSRTN